jgi:periplasmic nitrate reductase NapE
MHTEQHQAPPLTTEQQSEKKKEWRLFIFIIVFLFPILTVAIVGAMGFSIWFYQLIMGPPGPY